MKLGEHARLSGLDGFLSELNGARCVLEGVDSETQSGFIRLPGGFMETVPLECLRPE